MFYLTPKIWSHRFENRFFTLKMDHRSTALEAPPHDSDIGGRTKLPAYYYEIEICPGSGDAQQVLRRYSEFEWLYHKLQSSPPPNGSSEALDSFPTLPPKTSFCQTQSDEFRFDRQIELLEFLDDALTRPGYAQHPAVKQFLLLNRLEESSNAVVVGDEKKEEGGDDVDMIELAKLKEQFDKEDAAASGDFVEEEVDEVVEAAEEIVVEAVEELVAEAAVKEEVIAEVEDGSAPEVAVETAVVVDNEETAPEDKVEDLLATTPTKKEMAPTEPAKEEEVAIVPSAAPVEEAVEKEEEVAETKEEPEAVVTIPSPVKEKPEVVTTIPSPVKEKIEEVKGKSEVVETSIPIETVSEEAVLPPTTESDTDDLKTSTSNLEPVAEKGESLLENESEEKKSVKKVADAVKDESTGAGEDNM